MRFTVYYTVIVTIAIFSVAFPLALFVEKPRPLTGFYRAAFFLPVVVGFGSASLLWAWLMNVDVGLFSPLAQRLGMTGRAGQPARSVSTPPSGRSSSWWSGRRRAST